MLAIRAVAAPLPDSMLATKASYAGREAHQLTHVNTCVRVSLRRMGDVTVQEVLAGCPTPGLDMLLAASARSRSSATGGPRRSALGPSPQPLKRGGGQIRVLQGGQFVTGFDPIGARIHRGSWPFHTPQIPRARSDFLCPRLHHRVQHKTASASPLKPRPSEPTKHERAAQSPRQSLTGAVASQTPG